MPLLYSTPDLYSLSHLTYGRCHLVTPSPPFTQIPRTSLLEEGHDPLDDAAKRVGRLLTGFDHRSTLLRVLVEGDQSSKVTGHRIANYHLLGSLHQLLDEFISEAGNELLRDRS